MDFGTAIEILNNAIKTQDFSNLYREIPDRAANPEIWDEQAEFWKTIILKLVIQDRNIIFNVDEASKNLMWNEIYPPFKPALISLMKAGQFVSLNKFMKKKKLLFFELAERFICTNEANESENNEFVVMKNLKSICDKVKLNVISKASATTDFIISDEEICNMYNVKSIVIISKYLTDNKYAKRLDGGFFFYNDGFSPLGKKEEDAVIALRKAIEQVNKHINKLKAAQSKCSDQGERESLERKIRNAMIRKDSGMQSLNLLKEGLFTQEYINKCYDCANSIRDFVFSPSDIPPAADVPVVEPVKQVPQHQEINQPEIPSGPLYPELPDLTLMQPIQPMPQPEPIMPARKESFQRNEAPKQEEKKPEHVETVISKKLLDDDDDMPQIPTRSSYGMMPRKTFFGD